LRYFFHVRDGQGVITDDEGSELPDIIAARKEARESAKDFLVDALQGGPSILNRRIEIADAAGEVLETLPMIRVLH
jgi:hypothetical protein